MEGLAPSLKCLIEMRVSLLNAEPVRIGLQRYIESASVLDDFAPAVRRFLFAWDQGHDWRTLVRAVSGAHRRALLELASTAMGGQPILGHLDELRAEIETAVDLEIREHLELLPLKMLVPLLLLQFPAFLVLLFGPLLNRLIEEISK